MLRSGLPIFVFICYGCACLRRFYWRYSWSCFDPSGGGISNASVAFVKNATGFRYITTSEVRKWRNTYM